MKNSPAALRKPSDPLPSPDPSPAPIGEPPPDDDGSPDVPVREPEPLEPNQI